MECCNKHFINRLHLIMNSPLTAAKLLTLDPYFRVEVLAAMPNPQKICWLAMHQDYSENFVLDEAHNLNKPESVYGEALVQRCVAQGHYGTLEHPQLVVACAGFPHSVMQQLRTHRVGVSFDVQSSRYSGKRFLDVTRDIEELVYLRPANQSYADRQGSPYVYTPAIRERHLAKAMRSRAEYVEDLADGLAEEHARGNNFFDIRQNFVISANLRTWLHLLMLRNKKDAQLECQAWCEGVLPILRDWAPQVLEHWESKGNKLKLTP
jgi:thymidylate synthase (FAD)